MEIGEAPKGTIGAVNEGEAGHTKLEDMIKELSGTLTSIKHEQDYMHVRSKSSQHFRFGFRLTFDLLSGS